MSDFNENIYNESFEEKFYTLIFCRRKNTNPSSSDEAGEDEILLGMKKRGFGAGKWNGFGGKIEVGETAEQGAIRELLEESCLTANDITRRGYLVFNMEESKLLMRVHVYDTFNFTGEPIETEEMRPAWFKEKDIPLDSMWPDDKHWLSYLLQGKSFMGRFDYSDDDTIEDFSVKEV